MGSSSKLPALLFRLVLGTCPSSSSAVLGPEWGGYVALAGSPDLQRPSFSSFPVHTCSSEPLLAGCGCGFHRKRADGNQVSLGTKAGAQCSSWEVGPPETTNSMVTREGPAVDTSSSEG